MPTESPASSTTIQLVVDEVFARCTMRYGREFLARWAGLKLHVVKADWCRVLEGLEREDRRHALDYALDNLPPEPPRADQFKALANRAPDPRDTLKLNAPPPNPKAVAAAMAEASKVIAKPVGDLLSKHREHMAREIAGERIPMAQRDFWRVALRSEILRLYGMDTAGKQLDLQELGRRIAERAQTVGVPS